MLVVDAEGIRHLGVPMRFRDEPAKPSFKVPGLGENDDIIASRHR
jgi:hypothetical protein